MKRSNCYMLMAVAFSLMLPCVASEAVQTAAKDVLENMTGKNLAKLYKVRTEAETADQREVIVQVCISGLYAIGDAKNAKKINQGASRDDFMASLMVECDLCHGAGCSQGSCYKCKGSGACQNRKCSNGTVMGVGFDGRSNARKCSNCGGLGKCANCKGSGKIARTCSRCNGSKRIIGKEVALASCKDMLHALIDVEDEVQGRKRAESASQLARQMVEKEKQDRENAETDVRRGMEPEKTVVKKEPRDYVEDEVDDVERKHGFKSVESRVFYNFRLQIRALPNGRFNIIGHEEKHETQKRVERFVLNGSICYEVGESTVEFWPLAGSGRLLGVKTVVFYGDISKVFGAFRMAFDKAYEWIELGKKNGRTPSELLDMNIEVPDACALEIPGAVDTWVVFNELANSTDFKYKQTKSGFKFWFSDKARVLRFQCGDVSFDFRWDAKADEKTLANAKAACDENRLLQLYMGRPGDADLFSVGQRCSAMPLVKSASVIPKWGSGSRGVSLQFPNGMLAGMAPCADGGFNYFLSPYSGPKTFLTQAVVFPNDCYDDAYHAIEEAFRTALAWKAMAQENHVLNIVKEIAIPCPASAAVRITGTKGVAKLLWDTAGETDQAVKPTKFWFSVDTLQTWEGGKRVYRQKDSEYHLTFGNDDARADIELNDANIAAFSSLNPQLALQTLEAVRQEKSVFK